MRGNALLPNARNTYFSRILLDDSVISASSPEAFTESYFNITIFSTAVKKRLILLQELSEFVPVYFELLP